MKLIRKHLNRTRIHILASQTNEPGLSASFVAGDTDGQVGITIHGPNDSYSLRMSLVEAEALARRMLATVDRFASIVRQEQHAAPFSPK